MNFSAGNKARTTQAWIETHIPGFIRAKIWPSSPDLNPVDYKLWQTLEDTACSKRHGDVEKSLEQAVAILPLEIDSWPKKSKTYKGLRCLLRIEYF